MSKMAFRHGAANARCVELVQTQNIYRVLARLMQRFDDSAVVGGVFG